MEKKIQNRFKKLQRNRAVQHVSKDVSRDKGGRPSGKERKCWELVPEETQSSEEVDDMVKEIKKEWKKSKKDHGRLSELMAKTYARRRELVLVEVQPLGEVIK